MASSVPILRKSLFHELFANFILVYAIERIAIHAKFYETCWVFYILAPEARGYKTHNLFIIYIVWNENSFEILYVSEILLNVILSDKVLYHK